MLQKFINTSSTPDWSAYGLNEYLLLIKPDEHVHHKVMKEKYNFFYLYKEKIAIETKPHITTIVFLSKPQIEDQIGDTIQNICNQFRATTVTLHNYKGFKPRAIYLNVQDPQPIKKLAKSFTVLNNLLAAHECPEIRPANRPHLTLARGLREQTYERAILKYRHRHFFESFIMSELVLLKRPYDGHKCTEVATFNLRPRLTSHPTTTSYQLKLDL